MGVVDAFYVPELWHEMYSWKYVRIATDVRLPKEYGEPWVAETLVQLCVNAAIAHRVDNCVWSPGQLRWERGIEEQARVILVET